VKKVCITVKMEEIDSVIYEAKRGEWQLVKKGRKYLYFKKGFFNAKINKKRYENFSEDRATFEIWISEISEFMHSTYLYCKGNKKICKDALNEMRQKYENNDDVILEIEGVSM